MSTDVEHREGDLRTSYVGGLGSADQPDETDLVLGVIRYKYDFVERTVDRNVPALAPPEALLDRFKRVEEAAEEDDDVLDPTRVAWDSVGFRTEYLGYLERRGPQACLTEIRNRLADGENVWLVCLEANDIFCHRRLLEARVHGSSPAHYTEIYDPPEPEDEPEPQASLGSFGGGKA